jgi:hypothetical protein
MAGVMNTAATMDSRLANKIRHNTFDKHGIHERKIGKSEEKVVYLILSVYTRIQKSYSEF